MQTIANIKNVTFMYLSIYSIIYMKKNLYFFLNEFKIYDDY